MKTKRKAGYIGSLVTELIGKGLGRKGHWEDCFHREKTRTKMAEMLSRWELDVPDGVKWLRFTLYTKPGPDRVELRVGQCRQSQWTPTVYPVILDGGTKIFDRHPCDLRLSKYIGKPVYVEVEYLEPLTERK